MKKVRGKNRRRRLSAGEHITAVCKWFVHSEYFLPDSKKRWQSNRVTKPLL